MNLLLDSHALLWLADSKRTASLGPTARRLIDTADAVYFSSITVVELRIKSMLGRLKLPADFRTKTLASGLILLDFSADDADEIERFPSLARHDPFDRMLLAQASNRNMTLLTADSILLGLPLPFITDLTA